MIDFLINTSSDHAVGVNNVKHSYIWVEENETSVNLEVGTRYILIIYESARGIKYVVVDEDVIDSLFIKLLYLRGHGLDHFSYAFESDYPCKRC